MIMADNTGNRVDDEDYYSRKKFRRRTIFHEIWHILMIILCIVDLSVVYPQMNYTGDDDLLKDRCISCKTSALAIAIINILYSSMCLTIGILLFRNVTDTGDVALGNSGFSKSRLFILLRLLCAISYAFAYINMFSQIPCISVDLYDVNIDYDWLSLRLHFIPAYILYPTFDYLLYQDVAMRVKRQFKNPDDIELAQTNPNTDHNGGINLSNQSQESHNQDKHTHGSQDASSQRSSGRLSQQTTIVGSDFEDEELQDEQPRAVSAPITH